MRLFLHGISRRFYILGLVRRVFTGNSPMSVAMARVATHQQSCIIYAAGRYRLLQHGYICNNVRNTLRRGKARV